MRYVMGLIVLCGLLGACGDSSKTSGSTGPVTQWLLAVGSAPGAGQDAVGDETASYTVALNIPADANAASNGNTATNANAMFLRQGLLAPRTMPNAKKWEARIAYETARHAAMSAPLENTQGIPWALRGHDLMGGCTLSSACGTSAMCWKGACSTTINPNFIDGSPMNCNVIGVIATTAGTEINVVADSNLNLADPNLIAGINAAVTAFGSTFDAELGILGQSGHTGAVDRDGDGRFTIIFSNRTGAGLPDDASDLSGFFAVADFLNPGPAVGGINPDGNQADIMWVRADPNNLQPQLIAGTISHEYVHMTSYALRVWGPTSSSGTVLGQEDVWLDEGTAHLMEDLTGWGSSSTDLFLATLQYWTQKGALASGTDTVYQRGQAYALLRYLVDQQAKQNGAADASTAGAAQAANTVVAMLLRENKLGWQHAIFQDLGSAGLGNWLQAVYVTGNSAANAANVHQYDYLPVKASATTHVLMGFNPRGTYTDTAGSSLTFPGPQDNPVTASSADLDDSFLATSSAFYPTSGYDASHAQLTSTADPNAGPFLYVIPMGTH